MKQQFCFLLFAFCFVILASCSGKKDKTQTIQGDIDFNTISADTTMQNNIEHSYEYVKDYSFGNAQYSIVWGGFTGFDNVLIIKREDVTQQDTLAVVKCDTLYRLADSFIEDKNQDKTPEIRLVFAEKNGALKHEKEVLFSQGSWKVK